MPEGMKLEYKEDLDPTGPKDRLALVREVVAMANAEGGRVLVGVRDDGTVIGVPEADRPHWDPAVIGDLLDSFVNPEHVEVRISFNGEGCPAGRSVVELVVTQHQAPPLVLCKDGNHPGADSPMFRKGVVLVRHNTKVEPARRSDFLRWREDLRNRILQQFQMVVEAPETAHLRMVADAEVRDEPQYLLSRAVDLFRQRREKLLDGDDLLYLFENRTTLDLTTDDVAELLIQSALRRRATLFFWLALVDPSPEEVREVLDTALAMSDRDKSDMASAVPMVASLYLTEDQYKEIVARMEASSYAHIREAAADFSTLATARAVVDERRTALIEGTSLADLGDDELVARADELVTEGNVQKASRRMTLLGLEFLGRRLELE
jgi:hypothetical protein